MVDLNAVRFHLNLNIVLNWHWLHVWLDDLLHRAVYTICAQFHVLRILLSPRALTLLHARFHFIYTKITQLNCISVLLGMSSVAVVWLFTYKNSLLTHGFRHYLVLFIPQFNLTSKPRCLYFTEIKIRIKKLFLFYLGFMETTVKK